MSIDIKKLKQPKVFEQSMVVLDMISQADVDVKKLARLIAEDPVLSATLIRYANAPMYRRLTEVRNVLNAVNLLGICNVRLAVFVATMRATVEKPSEAIDLLWEHSFAISTLSKMIARKIANRIADDIELTALVHDMGALILATNFPAEYNEILQKSRNEEIPLSVLEEEKFGYSHDAVFQACAQDLRLPEVTTLALQSFHEREPLTRVESMLDYHIAIVSLAHWMALDTFSSHGHPVEYIPDSRDSLLMYLGLSTDQMQNIAEEYENYLDEKYKI